MSDINFDEFFDGLKAKINGKNSGFGGENRVIKHEFDSVSYIEEAINLAFERKAIGNNYEVIVEVGSQIEALRLFNVLEIVSGVGEITDVSIDVDENFGNELTSIYMNIGEIPVTISCNEKNELYYGECVDDIILVDLRFETFA